MTCKHERFIKPASMAGFMSRVSGRVGVADRQHRRDRVAQAFLPQILDCPFRK